MNRKDDIPWKKTACILCSLNCGLEVQLGGENGREFVRIRGDKEHPESKGYLCEKPQRLNRYQNAADRLDSPLRRRADGSYERVSWETAIDDIVRRFREIQRKYGGDKILYYGGGGQGNHLGGAYGDATLKALGVKYRSNALAQEKTGEFWVNGRMMGAGIHGDFEHSELSIFIGKNPWQSHGFARARVVLKEIKKDPKRKMVVIDPRVSETAAMADLHLRLRPGSDAWCLAGIAAAVVQDGHLKRDWLAEHSEGLELVEDILAGVDISACSRACEVPEEDLRQVAAWLGEAQSASVFEDLGMQMNRHSTLGSYLQRLAWVLTGHFGRKGTNNAFVPFLSLARASKGDIGIGGQRPATKRRRRTTPVTNSKIIIGLMPCNVMAEEILADHPDRFRAMLIESGNPVHSVADSPQMREAMEALEFSVVIDVAMTETARCADYVLPAASQFEKAECTFFTLEFPDNVFQLRPALFEPTPGTLPEAEIHSRIVSKLVGIKERHITPLRLAARIGRPALAAALGALLARHPDWFNYAPVLLYRALGPELPPKLREGAVVWALSHLYLQSESEAASQAGYSGPALLAAERLFDDILANPSGVVYASMASYADGWKRLKRPGHRIQLAIPELFADLVRLSYESPAADAEYPFVLSAGERRSETTNTILRDPAARPKPKGASLRMSPSDADALGLADGELAQITTRRGRGIAPVEVTDMMRPGHVSLPNGYGLEYGRPGAAEVRANGVSTNELTRAEDRDRIAGTPWHKSVPARIEKVADAAP
jgi:anaerobic selenocysteine-containing dehydrogenase